MRGLSIIVMLGSGLMAISVIGRATVFLEHVYDRSKVTAKDAYYVGCMHADAYYRNAYFRQEQPPSSTSVSQDCRDASEEYMSNAFPRDKEEFVGSGN